MLSFPLAPLYRNMVPWIQYGELSRFMLLFDYRVSPYPQCFVFMNYCISGLNQKRVSCHQYGENDKLSPVYPIITHGFTQLGRLVVNWTQLRKPSVKTWRCGGHWRKTLSKDILIEVFTNEVHVFLLAVKGLSLRLSLISPHMPVDVMLL